MEKDSGLYNLNKGYAKQEKQDLLNDNPIAKDASGGRGGSWMSKHSQSKIGDGSPLHNQGDPGHKKRFNYGDGLDKERTKKHKKKVDHKMDGSHSTMIKTSPNKMKGDLDKDGKMSGYEAKRQAAIEKNMKK